MRPNKVGAGANPAHPRSRGEHITVFFVVAFVGGSSPLARGTSRLQRTIRGRRRLIPARAGNIRSARGAAEIRAAHPRSRGEHLLVRPDSVAASGSSPLARGTLDRHHRRTAAPRLIPARAGNITCLRYIRAGFSAHPRSRGEHYPLPCTLTPNPGSSPLARGTSTPMGKLILSILAHPRSRGEHSVMVL